MNRTPEQLAAAREKELFKTICPRFVRSAAEILEAMLPPALTPPAAGVAVPPPPRDLR